MKFSEIWRQACVEELLLKYLHNCRHYVLKQSFRNFLLILENSCDREVCIVRS